MICSSLRKKNNLNLLRIIMNTSTMMKIKKIEKSKINHNLIKNKLMIFSTNIKNMAMNIMNKVTNKIVKTTNLLVF